jgi:DNA repair exonuclease SbcCD nuclease subunit
MKVLCSGDLHIGRRPTHLPSHVDCRPLSCGAIWTSLVDYAINQQVDVVALSGDVVDRANRYFEAIGPLERGLKRLGDAGIRTVAVAGNHDYDVLPDLARALPADAFRLLGVGGKWERERIQRPDGSRLDIDGWSFPTEHVRDNPVEAYRFTPDGDTPVLGLVHADLNASGSVYAPVTSSDLRARPVAFWLLGHVHAPALHAAPDVVPILYPGSPQPMDPGEPGVHGVWLLDIQPGAPIRPRRIPLATVRYEALDVDVSSAHELDALRPMTLDGVNVAASTYAEESDALRYLSLRVRITGRTALHGDVERMLEGLADEWDGGVNRVSVFIDRLENETRAPRDLSALAPGSDAVAVLARLITACRAPQSSPELAALLREAEHLPHLLRQAKPYQALAHRAQAFDLPPLAEIVEQEASRVLDALLATPREDA